MNNVAPENVLVELPMIELNESPVFRKLEGRRGYADSLRYRGTRTRLPSTPPPSQPVLKLLPVGSCLGVLALDDLPQSPKLVLVGVDHEILVANLVHDGVKSILEGPAAEVDDLATRNAAILGLVELVRIFAGRESNMAGGKEEDSIAPVAFAEIETAGSFEALGAIGRPSAGVNGPRTSAVGSTEGS